MQKTNPLLEHRATLDELRQIEDYAINQTQAVKGLLQLFEIYFQSVKMGELSDVAKLGQETLNDCLLAIVRLQDSRA
jgi:hypothetical protein